jgi:class 3 adenylate cyclase
MSPEQQQIESAMAALERQREALGDLVVEAMMDGLRAKLATLARAAALQRRQVTVLFADVVGSTALAQRLEAEETLGLLSAALRRMADIVEAHQGRVLRFTGDGLKAVFGVDRVREDDAERAVRAGLAILQAGRTQAAEAQRLHGIADFAVRVGLHTGDVALGAGVEADNTAMGAAVNIAARMEQTAPPGAMRISHDTYAQVRGMFEVEAQTPLALKGVDLPMQSYVVKRAKPRQFRIGTRGIEGIPTRMVGREAELEALQAAYLRLFAERTFAAVSVVAEAGVGKSRLLVEFEAWSETRPESFLLFRGRATPQTATQAFGLLRDILAWRFQILDDDSIAAARQKMEDAVVPLFVHDHGPDLAEAQAHLLGHLIGIEWRDSRHLHGILDDPRQLRNRGVGAAAQLFRRVCASNGSPLVLEIEDLHWADDETLDFLNHLAAVNRDVPLLVVASTRPSLFERRTDRRSTEGVHQRIDLQPLDKHTSRDLAGELLKKLAEIPAALRELLTSSAEGNPFYMEELVKMLIDQGAIHTGEPWSVDAERLMVTQVPSTLVGVLQARLDGLPAPAKRALQLASIVGAVFWDQALDAIEPHAAEQLPSLVERQLAVPRAHAAVEGLREYAFQHQLLYQVTYDTVLKRHKREGHARVAHWLAGLTEGGRPRGGEFTGLAALHFEQAGDEVNAAEFHARAAEQAGARLAHDRVLAHVDRALALLGQEQPSQAEQRWRLLTARERTYDLQARRDNQLADLRALAQLADLLADDHRRADVARRRAQRALRVADWTAQEAAAREGMAHAARAGDDGLRLSALRLLAIARIRQGDLEAGESLALQGLAETRRLGQRAIEGLLLNELAHVAGMRGDVVGALVAVQQWLDIARETGSQSNEAICRYRLGSRWLRLGDLARARQELDAALQQLLAAGDRTMEGAALGELSTLALWQGDGTRALSLARSAMDITVAAQARDFQILAELRLGAAELSLGANAAARSAYLQARARAQEIGSAREHDASAGLALVALAEDQPVQALAEVEAVLSHVACGGTLDCTEEPRRIELTCHQALARADDPRAAEWLSRAHTALMAQADAIGQHAVGADSKQGFLHNIPHHREIVALRSKHSAIGGPPPKSAV